MFSSLASFLFGVNTTNSETNSERTANTTATENKNESLNSVDADHLYDSTSLSPSIAGAGGRAQGANKFGKNKRNNARQQNKRNKTKTPLGESARQANVLAPNSTSDEGVLDENEWFIVEKEETTTDDYTILNDSEEENKPLNTAVAQREQPVCISAPYSSIGLHSPNARTYSGRVRNRRAKGLSCSKLSPSRTAADGSHGASADGDIAQTGSTLSPNPQQDKEMAVMANNDFDTVYCMDESWFVTPPPCFTSIGPINMETSPYENLLIEHPSMSVYHSIKMAQKVSDGLVKLDELAEEQQEVQDPTLKKNTKAVEPSRGLKGFGDRLRREQAAQKEQERLIHNMQKIQIKQEQQIKNRCNLLRTNRVRNVDSRNHIKRRSDRQYSRFCSYASNNRKTNCY